MTGRWELVTSAGGGKPGRSCRTCAYWGRPPRALKDRLYPCWAPFPTISGWADSFTVEVSARRMERDDGAKCPAWRPRVRRGSK